MVSISKISTDPALQRCAMADTASRIMASVGAIDFPKDGFEAVIFDCDGTLVDSMPAHFDAWCEALASYGAGGIFQEDVFFAMGGRPTRDIVVDLNSEYGLKLDPDAIALAKREAFLAKLHLVELIDEVADFARSLAGKVPMAVASGGSRYVVEKTLRLLNCSDWFDEVVTADDVPNGKPAPDIFLKTAKLLGVDPAKCLVIEDAPPGVIAAQAAGMQVITVPMPLVMRR
jgi:HAD superfamily hydrolase (TIGR01509 family)